MNLKPTQPEEIELALEEESKSGKLKVTSHVTNQRFSVNTSKKAWDAGDTSAYRAAYLNDYDKNP